MQQPKTTSATYGLKKRFPSLLTSIWLGLGALVRVPLRNGAFVALLGVLQVTLYYALQGRTSANAVTPSVFLVVLAIIGLCGFFAAGLSAEKRWVRILLLTALHAAAQIYLGLLGVRYWPGWMRQTIDRVNGSSLPPWIKDTLHWLLSPVPNIAAHLAVYALVAGIASAVVVAVYLFVASLVNVNFNELFAGQRIEGYKNFLRLYINPAGDLTVYAIGLRRVRRLGPGWFRWQWKIHRTEVPTEGWFDPRGRPHRPHLIEKFMISPSNGPEPAKVRSHRAK
jgi:hypothetical protein